MSNLAELRAATTLNDFAVLLDTKTRTLIHTLYRVPEAQKYQTFSIPKKSGGERTIHAPIGKLKVYQRALANILYECDAELQEPRRRPLSHAYRQGQSIVTNAALHKNRRFVLNLDLEDFFPTFTFPRVRGFFIKDQTFALNPAGATIVAQIACFQGALPQGSPCSPIISDLIARILDQRLARFAKQHRVTYSRYADDITFSTNAKNFPAAIATGGSNPDDPWVLGDPLVDKIEGSDFRINHAKTRMQVETSRQMVTGLTVNEKVNISQTYWRGVRSMCHSLFKTGAYYKPGADLTKPGSVVTSLRPLRGALGHVFHVKSTSHIRPVGEPWSQRKPPMIFGQRTHEDFYFYDYFVALEHPLLVTEGLTDPVYLRNAIRRLAKFQPRLGEHSAQGFDYNVSFFNYENSIHKLLRMGGSDTLKTLAVSYENRLARYGHKPLKHPVIILLDSDSGLSNFSSAALNKFGKTVNLNTTDPFYHLVANLYVVKTPEPGGGASSCIEDLFGADKNRPLAGKILHLDEKTFDVSKHISKSVFAKKVIAKEADLINWTGFEPFLDRVIAVLDDYTPPPPLPLPPVPAPGASAAAAP
ncbi:MAG: retron Ec67 family RNA-directed DNA polymerase/endonuclease [Phenylobacterium sp.]|uniref:retron Ec67 family RNA-directed DNA polymerase/endonuclease n=1 Tax=Phenylobacterium sp. TaxID=1871053 RepID=UPI0027209700|nr:retron Ec67 family RNA-directed DNA polymerase/endonuclease [Phenylobacterium sp.]MDO8901963.1 retron Ec67 family RNA-directed DNA polymerase/endonuclease [Phenylobacterium sp.]